MPSFQTNLLVAVVSPSLAPHKRLRHLEHVYADSRTCIQLQFFFLIQAKQSKGKKKKKKKHCEESYITLRATGGRRGGCKQETGD